MPPEKITQPRIYRVTYRSGINGKLVRVFSKVPYSGVYALTETLTRAITTGQVAWFRLDPAKPGEITPKMRQALQRWPEALSASTEKTEVSWTA
jgi:hypothetical protein